MNEFPSLKNQLLIAMPSLQDADFSQSVTLICEFYQKHFVLWPI
jgi:putative AlgH/UPF0301 family transcriptional regulator